ncbi:hypothetical protein ACHAWF_017810 [Thalassiosira exigua]
MIGRPGFYVDPRWIFAGFTLDPTAKARVDLSELKFSDLFVKFSCEGFTSCIPSVLCAPSLHQHSHSSDLSSTQEQNCLEAQQTERNKPTMDGKPVDAATASVKEDSGGALGSAGKAKEDVGADMDWELSAAPKATPNPEGADVNLDEFDVESFSFESEEEEEDLAEEKPEVKPELATVFDMKVLEAAIGASADALDLVVGKDVVMVAGKTGVGKSTLIQGIAGKKICAIEHETTFSGEKASKTVFDAVDALPGFAIGHGMESKTNSINGLIRGDIVYLDSPGVEDTNGIEMDIATSALLSQVAKRCKSLRFVILVHCASLLEDRGGAFRSVLKFARTFVRDFNESKMSFMFLFTHTDEITGMNTSLDAKKRLQEEILRTAEGTKDEDVLPVLDFIRKCLKKNYLFVSVLYPLEMDFGKLTTFIEKKLKKVVDLTLASTCNLTLSSKLKLEGAVQSLVQSLRVAFRESSQDIAEVKDIQARLQYLAKYIDVDCVRHAAIESKAIADERVEHIKSVIKDLILRGTRSKVEFNHVHVQTLQEHLMQLQQLGGATTSKHYLESIEQALTKFQGEIVAQARSLDPFHIEMKKLLVWAEGFDDFAPFHAALCNQIEHYIKGLHDELSNVDVSSLDTATHEEIGIFVFQLYKLHSMGERLTQFPAQGVDIRDAVDAKDATMRNLAQVFDKWLLNAKAFASSYSGYEKELGVIASHVRALESFGECIQATIKDRNRDFTTLEDQVNSVKKNFEVLLLERFNSCCNDLKEKDFDLSWKPQLFWMQSVCNRFSELQGICWKRMKTDQIEVINRAKSALYKASGELENMSEVVHKHGMISGEHLAKELLQLESHNWLDELLPRDQKFVAESCSSVRHSIATRINEKLATLASRETMVLSPNSSEAIEKISQMLPELREIDRYTSIANAVESENVGDSLVAKCAAHLEKYAIYLSQVSIKVMSYWTSNAESGRLGYMRCLTRKVDSILTDVEALLNTGASDVVIKKSLEIRSSIHDGFAGIKDAVDQSFVDLDDMIHRKVALLLCIKACDGFSRVERRLVDYKKLQEHVRDLVSKEAYKIEANIGESSDWEAIDQSLEKFQLARPLDPFVNGEVSSRLQTLQRLRDQKEDQVDDLMLGMIESRNFKGIGEFLYPLSTSKDQIKQHSFQHHRDQICSDLESVINEVHRLLNQDSTLEENSDKAADNMDILVAARTELHHILASKLSLAHEMPKLHKRMNTLLRFFVKEIREAVKKVDFVQMVTMRRRASTFSSHLRRHLSVNALNSFEAAKQKSKMTTESMPQHVEKFFQSRFESGDCLMKSLTSLKQAKEIGSFPKLDEIYEATKRSIESKCIDTMKLVRTDASKKKCYDDLINYVHSLHRNLQGSLREHCSEDLMSKCEHLIEDLRRQKHENEKMLEFGGVDYKQAIERVALRLDHLNETPRYWSYLLWSDRSKTYVRLQKDLKEKVEGRFNQAQAALNSRDLVLVQECIEFLEHVSKKVRKHVPMVESRIQTIHGLCVNSFINLCDKAKQILETGNCLPFKELFGDYRGFVIHVPCILRSSDCQKRFALVNQLLYESLEHDVSTLEQLAVAEPFDSSQLRSQVLKTRQSGNFFADRLTLLHEEVNIHTHLKTDKWLSNIHKFCWEHFNHGRDLSKIKDCAILGVLPSAAKEDIDKAFRDKARSTHPDKNPDRGGAMFRKVKDAHERLLTMRHLTISDQTKPFDEILIGVGETLRDQGKAFMHEQRYDMSEKLLFELPNIKLLDDLVVPNLCSQDIVSSVYSIMKGYIEKIRVEVDSHWSARNYKDLNNVIADLKEMEKHFKAYPKIFPKSWDDGITRSIESEIESLGQKAGGCLRSRTTAKEKEGDFRRCFIQMGFVLVELPAFKAFTKSIMSGVLEKCLDSEWGCSYLFELGLSLQKGDESSNDDEKRIAQMIVSEFTYFKEVLTMVWNEEVSQKPVEDVVLHIKGEQCISPTVTDTLQIDRNQLLGSFACYEREYKSLLGDYIKPDADLKKLVHKTIALAIQVSPARHGDAWGDDLKQKIPVLLAGIFSLFTVLKSGASYNRIEEAAGSSDLGEKLLMKPHNIQVLSLLFMFGCGQRGQSSLESLLLQIRTGEGKSMILGAAACLLALLGYSVRTVCYSEYLSERDFNLFEEVFDRFCLKDHITYSKITTFAEDSTASKGDIRNLTESLLRGTLSSVPCPPQATRGRNTTVASLPPNTLNIGNSGVSRDISTALKAEVESTIETTDNSSSSLSPNMSVDLVPQSQVKRELPAQTSTNDVVSKKTKLNKISSATCERKEILLVDEVDVFFGSEFYGQTYNQVVEFREPEIEEILKRIWNAWSQGGRRLKLSDIKSMPEYARLLSKLSPFSFLLENEIAFMLNQVSKVDDVPYYLDTEHDRIGYKVMDTIAYDVTYGYATVFAYLKEHNKLKNKGTLGKVLAMPVSCGQFSYANISPHRILGVSGTLQALGEYERDILSKYGLSKFIFLPSVYGASNFDFDKAGEGIYFESNTSDFFHRISAEISASSKSKRAVVVFFQDRVKLNEFVASPTYRTLSRHKKLLTEDMSTDDKGYVISNAATAGQITLSTAVFGRGTDFFCKDDVVQKQGGVHIIQTFLSEELSEEIQIQGRTARQGKRGSYQMVLLESDLESGFGVPPGEKDKVPKNSLYDWLCDVRKRKHQKQCKLMQENLADATEKDNATHKYFDHLLDHNADKATKEFEGLYKLMKKSPMPSTLLLDIAFAIDVTGSMMAYSKCTAATIEGLIASQNSIVEKLKVTFPEISFKLRVGCLPFRDIDDKPNQFQDKVWVGGGHFTDDLANALQFIKSACQSAGGGADIAEDHMGAIQHCAASWNHSDDWTSDIKCLMLLSDAPSHGLVMPSFTGVNNYDSYSTRHPDGLTVQNVVSNMLSKDIGLFFCSFAPTATERTEEELSQAVKNHPDNKSGRGITRIPMVPKDQLQTGGPGGDNKGKHIIFVLDESGSMQGSWSGVVTAYNKYIQKRHQSQSDSDLVSVVQFDGSSRVTVDKNLLSAAPQNLSYRGGGTSFHPASLNACKLARETPASHTPVVVFMSDGQASDATQAAREFTLLNDYVRQQTSDDLELHVIAFGSALQAQLKQIASASPSGKFHASANTADLANVFVGIATNQNVATLLESEIAKQISEAVSDKLSLEYFGS